MDELSRRRAERIRAGCKALGLTQGMLARRTGASVKTVNRWEAGVEPRGKHRDMLELVLGILVE